MGSFTGCLKKVGAALPAKGKALVVERARARRAQGMGANEAALKAGRDLIAELREQFPRQAAPAAAAPAPEPAAPAGPSEAELAAQAEAERAAAARQAAIDARRASRETEREIFRALLANPEIVGMSAKNVAILVDAKAGDRVPAEQRALLARAIVKEAARRAAELEKQKHRDPAVFAAALAAAKEQDNIPADDAEMQAAYALGWTHALQGKTKSTVNGANLGVRVAGYEAAQEWMQTEEGAAWYEGRPVNKLQNTGLDLRRWYEQLQSQMKADEPDITKAWKQIERATARADLFAPLLPDGVTPGFRLYVTDLRDLVRPFKAWLEATYSWNGEEYSRDRYSGSDKSNAELMLLGRRYPSTYSYGRTVTQEEADSFESNDAFRAQWLRDRATEYIDQVRGITSVIEGTSSVAEAAGKWHERFIATFSDKRWNLDSSMLTAAGQAMVFGGRGTRIDAWAGETADMMQFSPESVWAKNLIANEATVELPTKATPLVRTKLDKINRTGPDLRAGQDVTPQAFKDRFGFADVGFGKWVGARQDQDHLNYAHDAFADLAQFFGAPESAIGFGGKLHFTIGALGRGKHSAHFSPNQPSPVGPVQVINLTNTQGDGAVAHEWIHALDHNLGGDWSRVRPRVLRYLTNGVLTVQRVEQVAARFLVGGSYWKGNKRDSKVAGAAYAMARDDVLRQTSAYKSNADKLGEDYWGNEKELIARAGEAWVFDKLGHASDYLVSNWVADGYVTQAKGYRGTPYPTGDERKAFNDVLSALAKAVRWENGAPTVKMADFEAALPDYLTEGERRAIELRDEANMQTFYERLLAEKEEASQRLIREKEERIAEEQRRLDELAEQKLKELQPTPTVDAPQASDTQGPLSEEELGAIFDQAVAELREETQEQPAAPATVEPVVAETPVSSVSSVPAGPAAQTGATPNNSPANLRESADPGPSTQGLGPDRPGVDGPGSDPTARSLIAQAAQLGVQGADEALTGLAKLFGGTPGRLNSFPAGFDEETYKQAKPHFESALRSFQAAGRTLLDLFKLLAQQFGDGIKPYAVRFAQDMKLSASLGENQSASAKLAEWVKARLSVGHSIDWRLLFTKADELFGGTQAEDKYTPKDAYDAVEMGVNQYILAKPQLYSPAVGPEDAMRAVAALQKRLELIPTQTKRTAEQDQLQQFSTVPPLAFVANWVAGVRATDVVLEPSAGVGGLAAFARNAGAKVVLNEYSSRRAALLREVLPGAEVFQEDAEFLHNILPDRVQPTLVVMNPPFSNSTGGVKDTMVGARHVEQALQRLPDGGRLVAIVGEGMAMDKAAFKGWWKKIGARYDVRAAVPMDGKGYAKYGTTFDNVILVIDKVKPSGAKPVTTPAKDYTELVHLLNEVRNARPEPNAPVQDHSAEPDTRGAGGDGVSAGDGPAAPGAPVDGPAAGVGAGQPAGGSGVGGGSSPGRGSRRGQGAGGTAAEPGQQPADAGQNAGGSGTDAAADGSRPGAADNATGVTVESQATAATSELTDSVFEGYQPKFLRIPGAKAHPGALVESSAMSSVNPPRPTYTPNLPSDTIGQGRLSLAQLESTVYAGQAHSQVLEAKVGDTEARDYGLKPGTPYRRGFFIGDGTGVGKGREISGILLDNIRQGRKKHVWVSEKQGLMKDAARDFAGIQDGVTPESVLKTKAIFNQGEAKASDAISRPDGIIFTTYSTLRSAAKDENDKKKKGKTRVDQLVEWLGPDFDGVIAFDEAHNAGNAVPIKGDRGVSDPSAQALAVVELQKRLPGARVVYVSATGATEVSNLSFATRLGIWGPATPFESVQAFTDQMTSGGLATMELVARDLKQTGSYMARSLSFDGVTYSRLDHELSPLQHDIYNRLADAWQVVLNNLEEALKITGAVSESGRTKNSKAKSAALSAFWGAQQRFFNQIITSMQMPSVVEAIESDLGRGDAVVLQLVNTNEAQQERAMAKRQEDDDEADLEDLDLTPRDQLIDMVRKSFPVAQYTDVIDENGKKQTVQVMDAKGNPVENKEAVAIRDKLIKDLEQISVPDGPLEILINQFGPKVVAEVTGRKQRVVAGRWNKTHKGEGEAKAYVDKRGGAAARADAEAFMADKKGILVFSDAGGTGFSFQADLTKANQRKRQHYLLQPGWRANKAVQGLGRTHRTNQKSAPHYKLVATNIPAHKRFLSSIARRLDQLGALTKGQRDTSSGGLFSEKDNLESKYAERAVRAFLFDAKSGQIEGLEFNELLQQLGLKDMLHPETKQITESKIPGVRQFLNRLLSLKLEMQDTVFNAFLARMDEVIEQAAERGELDTGMQTIRALESKVTHEETVYVDERTGAETTYVELQLTHPTRIHQFPEEKSQGAKIEWVVNTTSGRIWAKIRSGNQTLKNGAVVERFRMLGTGGMSFKTAEDLKGYVATTEEKAREKWAAENAKKPATYTTKTHMIVGAMLPIWDRLKTDGIMQVARTQTNDGRRLLGRVIHEKDVAELRKRLNIAAPESKLPPAEVLARVLKGEKGELANGWTLERAKVSDDLRVEIKGLPANMGPSLRRELIDAGAIEERISWNTRYFIPVNRPDTLAAITKSRPLISLGKEDQTPALSQVPPLRQGMGQGVPVDHVRQMATQASAEWRDDGPRVFVVDSVVRLPVETIASLASMKALNTVRGLVLPDGRVYLIADRFDSLAEAQATLFHEVYGHMGMRAFLGDQYAAQMQLLRMANPKLAAEANTWYANFGAGQVAARVKRGMTKEAAEATVRLLAVEEALADRAGDAPPPRAWKSLMAKLQQALRRMGLDSVANMLERLTEAESYALLMNARRAVMRTGGPAHALAELPATMQPKRSDTVPVWYSALMREVTDAPMNSGTAAAWTQYLDAMVKRGAVKADEIEWTGVRDWLQLQTGKVSKDQVGQFLADNGVRVTETVLTQTSQHILDINRALRDTGYTATINDDRESIGFADPDGEGVDFEDLPEDIQAKVTAIAPVDAQPTKYGNYTLPGGTNYREVLLTLPAELSDDRIRAHLMKTYGFKRSELTEISTAARQKAAADLNKTYYRSSHWDQPNILAHIRLNDRVDADGKRVLFVEEIQSDWAQAGKKSGFSGDAPERFTVIDKRGAQGLQRGDFGTRAEAEAYQQRNQIGITPSNSEVRAVKIDSGIPRAPFVNKTDAWVALAIKRVISMAAREGYDRVAFVNGEQSAERYDLSKQVDSIGWAFGSGMGKSARMEGRTVTVVYARGTESTFSVDAAGKVIDGPSEFFGKGLDDIVGKDLAEKIMGEERGSLRGLELKVGGEGMRAFYDKIVPSVAKDVLRKVGGGALTTAQFGEASNYYQVSHLADGTFAVRMYPPIPNGEGAIVATGFQTRERAAAAAIEMRDEDAGTKQLTFDITPAMRAKAAGGLPLFKQNEPEVISQTDTAAFKEWFGTSTVVNADGTPKLMFHGTGANITEFWPKQAGAIFVTEEPFFAQAYADASTYWMQQRQMDGGQNILPLYVRAERPFDYDNPQHRAQVIEAILSGPDSLERPDGQRAVRNEDGTPTLWDAAVLESSLAEPSDTGNWMLVEEPWFQRAIRSLGFDSFYVSEGSFKNLGVYEANQLKSAIGNSGAFARDDDSILLSQRDPVLESAMRKAGINGPRTLGGKVRAFYGRAVEAVRDRKAVGQSLRQGVLDQFHGIQRAVTNEIGNLPVEQNPYITARLANGGTSSVMRALMLHGQARWAENGQHLEKVPGTVGLLDILKPLGNDLDLWFAWMVGNRAARLMTEGRENNLTADEIAALQALGTEERLPAFQEAARQYALFKRSVLDVAQQAGLINPESRRAWDHADYIPFYREIDERSVFSPTGKKGLAGQSSGIRKLKGGDAGLNDPMENLLMNFSRLIDASLKNNAIRKTIETLGESDLVQKVGYDMTPALVPREQVVQVLADAGTPDSILASLPDEVFEGIAKMWAIQAPTDPDVVRIMVGGKPVFYRVNDGLLLRALTSFVPFDFPGLALMRGAKRLLTAMVTSTPEFMARNWIRDSMAAQAITQTPFNPLESVKGIRKAYRESAGYESMLFAGASFQSGNVNAGDPESTGVHMRRALRERGMDASSINSFMGSIIDYGARGWEKYRQVGEAIENANREAVYEAATKAGKGTTAAAFEAKDLMDFSLRGSWAGYQLFADVLPFFNARVQGLYRLGRADPKRLMMVGTMMLAATAALALANAGEDWYEELPDWDKDGYWHIKVSGHHFRIPKPFELGVIFATLPERIARNFMGLDGDKKTLSRLWANVRDQLAFDPVPQLARPVLDVWANKDSFRDRPIENQRDESLRPHARSDARTSDTMRVMAEAAPDLADMTGLSPKKLEFLVNGYFGTVGMYALGAADYLVRAAEDRPVRPALRTDDLPLIRAFYAEDPAKATVFESDLYKIRKEVDAVRREFRAKAMSMNPGDREAALRMLETERDKLAAAGTVTGAVKMLGQINQQISRIYLHPTMGADTKRAEIDKLMQQRNDLARQAARRPEVMAVN